MKISREWLAEYVDLNGISDEKISEVLNLSGSENEIKKATNEFQKIVIGEIKEIIKHPGADKLQVTKTDVGAKHGGLLQIVCGAPNIQVGQKIPVALVGATVRDFQISKAKIRGVESFGMLCSEAELGISENHEGIMLLPETERAGTNFTVRDENETVFEFEITPNRSDCFSVMGLARELAAALEKKIKQPKVKAPTPKLKTKVAVEVKEPKLCPRYIAKRINNIKIAPSPKWVQSRLKAAGIRPINNIVDATNYVMLEWGQPLHAFDATKIKEPIVVRRANSGEKIKTLDGIVRELDSNNLLITDKSGPVALAGVMGGEDSEVDEKTKNIILEAAVFHGTNVRKTAQKFNLRTEASNRYEKGVSLRLPEIAIERAAELISANGGEVSENTDVLSGWIYLHRIGLRPKRLESFIGIPFEEKYIKSTLENLGFAVSEFDFKAEARKHVGKPYIWGASYKTHGEMAFDCSYLTDFIYSKIGKFIGHTALAQFMLGKEVKDELRPGDLLFLKGSTQGSATDHYYVSDGKGGHKKVNLERPVEVGHVAIYIGDGRIVHAAHYDYDPKTKKWTQKSKDSSKVKEDELKKYIEHPEYLGARRYLGEGEEWLSVEVPWWRLDTKTEQDLFEEIGRIYGYDNLPSTLPKGDLSIFEENIKYVLSKKIRHILSDVGFTEFYNYSFISKELATISPYPDDLVELENPTSPETKYLRSSLAGSMALSAIRNQENFAETLGYEIASTFRSKGSNLPLESSTLGLFSSGKKTPGENFYALKGAIELIFKRLNLGIPHFEKTKLSFLDGNSAADIIYMGKSIGYIGNLSNELIEKFGLKKLLALSEINLESAVENYGKRISYKPLPKYPYSQRDVNIILAKSIEVSDILKVKQSSPYLINLIVSDVYTGKGLPDDAKSVTIRLVLGSSEKTLTDVEIQKTQDEVVSRVTSKLKATLRGDTEGEKR